MQTQIRLLMVSAALVFVLIPNEKLIGNDSSSVKKSGIIMLPVIGYSPETKLEFGAKVSYYFRKAGSSKNSRPSTISPVMTYTQNKQFYTKLTTDLYFQNENYHVKAEFTYRKYPDLFFGIGNNVSQDDEENFSSNKTDLMISVQKKAFHAVNIGGQYEYCHLAITETSTDGALAAGNVWGSEGGLNSGVSFLIDWDTRDNLFAPRSGEFYQITSGFFNEWLGSDYEYKVLKADFRKYFSFFTTHSLALQAYLNLTTGEPPFNQLPFLGNDTILRGYHKSLYRDKMMLAFQSEYRLPVWWKFGLVGFMGFGDVARSFDDFNILKSKYMIGIGLRYFLIPAERMNIRLDFAFGRESSGIYLFLLDAF